MLPGCPASEGAEGGCWPQRASRESTEGLLLATRMMIAIVIIKREIKLIQEMLQRG